MSNTTGPQPPQALPHTQGAIADSNHGDTAAPRKTRRWVRRLRTTVVVGLVAWLVLTLASVGYNLATTPPHTLPPLAGQDVDVGGSKVHYQRWGQQGPAVVLVHGFTESAGVWDETARLLADRFQVYAIDLAGFGYTEYTGRYSLSDQSDLVHGFVGALRLERPVLVGHSLGAAVVGDVARRFPRSIRGIIFANGDGLPFRDPDQGQHRSSALLNTPYVTSMYRLLTRSERFQMWALRQGTGSRSDGLTPQVAATWFRPLQQGAAEQAFKDLAGQGVLALTPQQLKEISVPRAVIWGDEDVRSGGSLALAQEYLGSPPTIVMSPAGHLAMLSQPQAFANAIVTLSGPMTK